MKTDDLILRLGQDPPGAPYSATRLAVAGVASVALCSVLFLSALGVRPDLASAWQTPAVMAKTLIPACLFAISLRAAVLSARPTVSTTRLERTLALPVAGAIALWIWAYMDLPAEQRFAEVGAFSLSECVGFISLLALLPAAVLIFRLRNGATLFPAKSAFLAGLAAGSGAATGYSLFCVQDNPLFFVTWYGAAILFASLITLTVATRFLRW